MNERSTNYGRLFVGTKEELFAKAVALAAEARAKKPTGNFTWAFTGGSTPQDWYRWAASTNALPAALANGSHFTVSDERHVPLSSDQNNFGNASRLLLDPIGVPAERRLPWASEDEPVSAAAAYSEEIKKISGPNHGYDVCFLGMGDDAHTASFFPGSPLLTDDGGQLFAAVDVPGKGWRLTITPTGLRASGLIVVMTLGTGKAEALSRVINGPLDVVNTPSQILKTCADRVVWLVDAAAASKL